MNSPLQQLSHQAFDKRSLKVYIKRDDLIHPLISGNKWRKLKYNLTEAKNQGKTTLLTFGGAYSNHIYSAAVAAKTNGLKSIGIIRGEELDASNPTLSFAQSQGMEFRFVSRTEYRLRNSQDYLDKTQQEFPDAYIVPEGGTNALAIKGCAEILDEIETDYLITAVGTAGTISGLIEGTQGKGKVIGVSALKGIDFREDIAQWTSFQNYEIWSDYHFGGYAKVKPQQLEFVKWFKETFDIVLDPVYTSKMAFAFWQNLDEFPNHSTITLLHTGGLQGWNGMLQRGIIDEKYLKHLEL